MELTNAALYQAAHRGGFQHPHGNRKILRLALLLVGLSALTAIAPGCNGSQRTSTNSTAGTDSNTHNAPPQESPQTPEAIDLVKASSKSYVDYALSGIGDEDSTKMMLHIRNKTRRVWKVKVEVGTKLEPTKEEGVQTNGGHERS